MNYITTNIRISEEDYLRLKNEAARKRKSFSSVVRDKLGVKSEISDAARAKKLMARTRKVAKENAKYLKGWDSVKALREIRYKGK